MKCRIRANAGQDKIGRPGWTGAVGDSRVAPRISGLAPFVRFADHVARRRVRLCEEEANLAVLFLATSVSIFGIRRGSMQFSADPQARSGVSRALFIGLFLRLPVGMNVSLFHDVMTIAPVHQRWTGAGCVAGGLSAMAIAL